MTVNQKRWMERLFGEQQERVMCMCKSNKMKNEEISGSRDASSCIGSMTDHRAGTCWFQQSRYTLAEGRRRRQEPKTTVGDLSTRTFDSWSWLQAMETSKHYAKPRPSLFEVVASISRERSIGKVNRVRRVSSKVCLSLTSCRPI
jgi:hypothetical protein